MNQTAIAVVAVAAAMLAGAVLAPPLPDASHQTLDPEYVADSAVEPETPVPYADLTAREQWAFRAALSGDGWSVLYASDPLPHLQGGDTTASLLAVVRYQGKEHVVPTRGPGLPVDDIAVTAGLAAGGVFAALSGVTALLSDHASRWSPAGRGDRRAGGAERRGCARPPATRPRLVTVVPSLLTVLAVESDLVGRSWPGVADLG